MDRLQKIVENSFWLLSDKVARLLLGIFVTAMIARYLGPREFGIWNYSIALTTITGALAGLGLEKVLTKALVERHSDQGRLLGTALVLRLIAALLTSGVCWEFVRIFHPAEPAYLSCTMILSGWVLLQSFDVFDSYYQAQQRVRVVMIPKTLAFLVFCGIRVWFVHRHLGLLAFTWLTVWEGLTAYGVIIAIYLRGRRSGGAESLDGTRRPNRGAPIARTLLAQAWPLLFTNLSILIYMKVDQLLLDGMTDATQLGEYVAATRLSELWYALPMAASTALLPALLVQKKEAPDRYAASMERWLRLSFWTSAVLCLGVTILAEPLSRQLYGAAYPRTGLVLQIHIWASVPVFMAIVVTQHLIIHSRYKATLYAGLAGTVVNIGCNLLLIPGYGSVGAAVATVLSYITVYAALVGLDRSKETLAFMGRITSPRLLYADAGFFRERLLRSQAGHL